MTIVYANRACYAQVYAAVQSLEANTVRVICEYLPAEGRKFTIGETRCSTVCDECFRSRSNSIYVQLLVSTREGCYWETPMFLYLCSQCSSMTDYETMFERGICSLRGRYYVDGELTLRADYYRLFSKGGLAALKHGVALANEQNSILSCKATYVYKKNAGTYFLTDDMYDHAITIWSGCHEIRADGVRSIMPIRSKINLR